MTILDENTITNLYEYIKLNKEIYLDNYVKIIESFTNLNDECAIRLMINYYKDKNDKDNLIKYCKKGQEINNLYSIKILIDYVDNEEDKLYYIKLAATLNDEESILYLANK